MGGWHGQGGVGGVSLSCDHKGLLTCCVPQQKTRKWQNSISRSLKSAPLLFAVQGWLSDVHKYARFNKEQWRAAEQKEVYADLVQLALQERSNTFSFLPLIFTEVVEVGLFPRL